MGKVMRHTLGASLNIRHNLSSSKGPNPLQLKLLTTYIPKTSAFTLAFSTSQRLRTTRASARTFFTFRHYITDRKSGSAGMPRPISYAVFCLQISHRIADDARLALEPPQLGPGRGIHCLEPTFHRAVEDDA